MAQPDDANGNRTSATDAAGHTAEASYDFANNNILWSEDAEGVRTCTASRNPDTLTFELV